MYYGRDEPGAGGGARGPGHQHRFQQLQEHHIQRIINVLGVNYIVENLYSYV